MANGALAPAQPMMPPAPARGPDNTRLLVMLAAAGGGGYLLYRYWWLPKRAAEILAAETQRRMRQGMSPRDATLDAFANVCGVGATAVGAAYGVPLDPRMMQEICRSVPGFQQTVQDMAVSATKFQIDLAKKIVGGAVDVGKIAVSGATQIAIMPFKASYNLTKGVVTDVWGAGKDVVSTVVVKPAEAVVKTTGKVLSKLNPFNW